MWEISHTRPVWMTACDGHGSEGDAASWPDWCAMQKMKAAVTASCPWLMDVDRFQTHTATDMPHWSLARRAFCTCISQPPPLGLMLVSLGALDTRFSV